MNLNLHGMLYPRYSWKDCPKILFSYGISYNTLTTLEDHLWSWKAPKMKKFTKLILHIQQRFNCVVCGYEIVNMFDYSI